MATPKGKKKVKKNIFNLALGNRNSRGSVKSQDKGSFKEPETGPEVRPTLPPVPEKPSEHVHPAETNGHKEPDKKEPARE